MATRLIEQLLQAAVAAGIERVSGQLSQDNPGVWRLLHRPMRRLDGRVRMQIATAAETTFTAVGSP